MALKFFNLRSPSAGLRCVKLPGPLDRDENTQRNVDEKPVCVIAVKDPDFASR